MPLVRFRYSDPDEEHGPFHVFPDRAAGWAFVRHLLNVFFSLFGTPARLMSLGGISMCHRADMNSWLSPAERLARILLLGEAATLKLPPICRRLPPKRRCGRFPGRDLRSRTSEEWSVRFTMLRGSTKRGSGAKGYYVPTIRQIEIAARFEALVRVVRDPAPYARRLAFALRRRADRRRQVAAILRLPKIKAGLLYFACAAALPLAAASPTVFDTG